MLMFIYIRNNKVLIYCCILLDFSLWTVHTCSRKADFTEFLSARLVGGFPYFKARSRSWEPNLPKYNNAWQKLLVAVVEERTVRSASRNISQALPAQRQADKHGDRCGPPKLFLLVRNVSITLSLYSHISVCSLGILA